MASPPRPVPQVRDISIPTPAGPITARVYGPARGAAGAPLVVYWHGGGWVIADLDTYDASARALQAETGAVVLSVHYRQAPEHRFPAAHEDALAAYSWAVANARSLGADPRRVAVAGESAGGNLALNVAIAARDAGLPAPQHMALIYPVAGTDTNTPSYRRAPRPRRFPAPGCFGSWTRRRADKPTSRIRASAWSARRGCKACPR